MNRMKSVPASNGNRKDTALAGNTAQYQQQYPNQQNTPPSTTLLPQPLLANYTLPGVISYLTSEFTNLERFKIMTNLEKSEMKYRIQQLTSEVNSLKFLNDKQAVRINALEEKLAAFQSDEMSDRATSSASSATKNCDDYEIPAVDLEVLRTSRQKLNRSIKDVYRLLKPPSMLVRNVMDIPGAEHGTNDYDQLLEYQQEELFEEEDRKPKKIESIFAKYTLDSDDLLSDSKGSFEEDSNNIIRGLEENRSEELIPKLTRHGFADESDTETVIVDEPEEAKLLTIDESELVNSNSEPPIKLGSVVHVPAAYPGAQVYPPFQHSFIVILGHTLTAWHRSTQILTGSIDESLDDVVRAFYLEKKRVLLVTKLSGVLMIEQKPDSDALRRVSLHKEDKLQINAASLVEFSRVGSNRVLGVAYSGKNKEGKLCIVALELKIGQKAASKPLAHFNSTFIKTVSDVTSLHWFDNRPVKQYTAGLPKTVLPKKHSMLLSSEEDSLFNFDVLFVHDKLLKVNLALKEVSEVYKDGLNSVEVAGKYALLVSKNAVILFDVAANKVVSSQQVEAEAHYSLLLKENPYIVQLDSAIHIYDYRFREVASGPSSEGEVVFSDADFVVVQNKQEVSVTAIEGTN